MLQERLVQRARPWPVAFIALSFLLHTAIFSRSCGGTRRPEAASLFELPTQVELGLADQAGGNQTPDNPSREPPPQPAAAATAPPRHLRMKRAKVSPDPSAPAQAAAKVAPDKPAAASGAGSDADGGGLGSGMGPGSGFAPAGANIALNVDLQRIRKTALLLETEALLDVIPEWQALLAGSGIDPMRDLSRLFVASPTLQRSNVVVAAEHQLPRARVAAAVAQLAAAEGHSAAFEEQQGYPVAAWWSHGREGDPQRSIALTGKQQLTITRTNDLPRVLQVAASLSEIRRGQGVADSELDKHGGLLAMEDREAVALWVEGARKYVRSDSPAVPQSVRLSIFPLDQFSTELSVRAQYASAAAAAEALPVLQAQRSALSEHARITFLGLKSAVDKAALSQEGSAVRVRVQLTLHQTRYLMGYVTRALKR